MAWGILNKNNIRCVLKPELQKALRSEAYIKLSVCIGGCNTHWCTVSVALCC